MSWSLWPSASSVILLTTHRDKARVPLGSGYNNFWSCVSYFKNH
jgi:hypothetical protein